jgi:molecular chaperone DnaK
MTITGGSALGKDEIDRMVKEAETFAAEDHKRRETAEARNQADQLVYQVEKFVAENGDKVPEADKTELATATDALKEALKDQDADAEKLQAAHEAVMTVFSRVGQAMYQSAQAAQDAAGGAGAGGTGSASGAEAPAHEDEVVEGEIVEEGDAS